MDHFRFIQILQELLNSQNNTVLALNSFIQEAQMSNYSSYSESDYTNLQNYNITLQNQINEVSNSLARLQDDYQSLLNQVNTGSASQNAEVSALRSLLEAVTVERDSLQSQISDRDSAIVSLQSRLNDNLSSFSDYTDKTSEYQSQITELNNKLTEALNTVHAKNNELLDLESKVESLKSALSKAKEAIASELEEAKSDIDTVLDSVDISSTVSVAPVITSGYTAVPFVEITRYLKGTNVSLKDVLCKGVLYQDPELTSPSPGEGSLTLDGVVYATDHEGVIRVAGTSCD